MTVKKVHEATDLTSIDDIKVNEYVHVGAGLFYRFDESGKWFQCDGGYGIQVGTDFAKDHVKEAILDL